jgi:hypothetical protein
VHVLLEVDVAVALHGDLPLRVGQVDLGHESIAVPHLVVQHRLRKAVLEQQGHHQQLELAVGDRLAMAVRGEHLAKPTDAGPTAASVADQRLDEVGPIDQSHPAAGLHVASKALRSDVAGEVEQGPSRIGHGNAVDLDDAASMEVGALMDADALPSQADAPLDRELDGGEPVAGDLEAPGSGEVRHTDETAGREDRGQHIATGIRWQAVDGVHPTLHPLQAVGGDSAARLGGASACLAQLLEGDQAAPRSRS